jgi:hypothetical protein
MSTTPVEYSIQKGIAKGCMYGAKLIVAFTLSHGIKFAGTINGVAIDLQSEVIIAGLLNSIIITGTNALKIKYPKYWWWI